MSMKVTKGNGVIVLALAADPKSYFPPLCQIISALCYNPLCCGVSQGLRRLQATSQQVLGTIQIMIGLLTIALGAIRLSAGGPNDPYFIASPYWLGVMYIAVGIMCILVGNFPSACMLGLGVVMNIAGAAIAITGIVLYAMDLTDFTYQYHGMCSLDNDYQNRRYYDYDAIYDNRMTTTSPMQYLQEELKQRYIEKCNEMKSVILTLLGSLDIILVILAILQLCVNISSFALGIKALKKHSSQDSCRNVEDKNPLLEDVTTMDPLQGEP